MVRLVGLEPTTGKTPVDFKPTAYANFATAAPATRLPENITRGNYPHNLKPQRTQGLTRHKLRESCRALLPSGILSLDTIVKRFFTFLSAILFAAASISITIAAREPGSISSAAPPPTTAPRTP